MADSDEGYLRKPDVRNNGASEQLPYPDSDWSPALQRTIKNKLDKGEIDEVDSGVFYGMMGQISQEKDGQK